METLILNQAYMPHRVVRWQTAISMFFTGKLYARDVISQKQRELCAVASLTVLHRPHELRAHIHAALNVGATRQEVATLPHPGTVNALRFAPDGRTLAASFWTLPRIRAQLYRAPSFDEIAEAEKPRE